MEEVLSLKASSKKIFCCDFSSDGALLASAGDENKVKYVVLVTVHSNTLELKLLHGW